MGTDDIYFAAWQNPTVGTLCSSEYNNIYIIQ